MKLSAILLLAFAVLAILPAAFSFMLVSTPLALRPATSFSSPVPSLRTRSVAVTMSKKEDVEEEEEALEECMLVMKPCEPGVTTDEDLCLDEEMLNECVEKSEAALQNKMARLAVEDKKEEMLQDGSF
mmetsp:Transcript_9751/g.19482  ORF Transcript_9751/g.19482 Transcript_9751/m.19482 type:complete len:128 (-) Transcript_9751:145-528(-)|eukprot:CAMPEP_0181319996 /NCGR_PEP_ID=MMETSP1101-20121128/17877_1 /TAXON_ID=46948 /ORGANISM="Rhodomonas abbreviata, Strain Caron Lab Isolate" /LENGTH=127 /DNA_ID=CAMNT_0023427649 /DNA_START=58 /DNA_END=441 /DNA_ORIENTATION=+